MGASDKVFKPAGMSVDVCKYYPYNNSFIPESKTSSTYTRNDDVNGDGTPDLLIVRDGFQKFCPDQKKITTTTATLEGIRLGSSAPSVYRNMNGSSFRQGDVVVVGDKNYILIQAYTGQEIYYNKDGSVNRDALVMIIVDPEYAHAMLDPKQYDPNEVSQSIQDSVRLARLGDLNKATSEDSSSIKAKVDFVKLTRSLQMNISKMVLEQILPEIYLKIKVLHEGQRQYLKVPGRPDQKNSIKIVDCSSVPQGTNLDSHTKTSAYLVKLDKKNSGVVFQQTKKTVVCGGQTKPKEKIDESFTLLVYSPFSTTAKNRAGDEFKAGSIVTSGNEKYVVLGMINGQEVKLNADGSINEESLQMLVVKADAIKLLSKQIKQKGLTPATINADEAFQSAMLKLITGSSASKTIGELTLAEPASAQDSADLGPALELVFKCKNLTTGITGIMNTIISTNKMLKPPK